jgi:hypothetical protein
MMMPRLALCYIVALAAAPMATFAAGSPQCSPPASVECALQRAGVRDPASMTESLTLAELRTVDDVAGLDTAEAAELFGELRAAAIPLGDRARLRKVAWAHPSAWDRQQWGGPGDESAMMFQSGSLPSSHETRVAKTPNAAHRQLQSGGGVSVEVIAIAFTGLIGMIGYAVQARSAQKASQAQASLGREAAEREKAEAKAGKQLERVQMQMAEWVRPLVMENQFVVFGWRAIARECNLLAYLGLYGYEHVPQPATPYIDLVVVANPGMYAAYGRAPYAQLPPQDLALLAADPALRSRYCELAAAVLLPPLRRLRQIFSAKSHLNESVAPARLDTGLPGIGRTWASLLGTLSVLYFKFGPYVAQFESLLVRWQEERFDLLQPDAPGMHVILEMLVAEQIRDVSTKEMQLVGVSGGSRAVAGGLDFMKAET